MASAQGDAHPQSLVAHRQKAQQYLAEKRPDLAIPELRQVVALDPSDVDAQANLGVLLYFGGQYAQAVAPLRTAIAAQPGLAKIQALLGLSEQRSGDLPAASHDLAAALPAIADLKFHTEAGLALVEVQQALGSLSDAAATVSALRASAPDNPQVLAAAYQVYRQGMSESLLSLAVSAPNSAELPFVMGLQLVQGGDSDKAIPQFRKALAIDPNLPGLHFVLAQALRGSSDPALHAQAEGEFRAAVKLNPFDQKAWLGLADTAADAGALNDAAADYGKALALAPNDAETATGFAKVLVAKGDRPKAIALLEHAVAADPTDITAHYRLSTLYKQAGRSEDAKQQLAQYEHYKALRAQLEAAIKTMRGAPGMGSDTGDKAAQP